MKTIKRLLPFLLLLNMLLLLLLSPHAFAQDATAATNALPALAAPAPGPNPIQGLLDGLLGKYGWISTVVMVIGTLRILFKPVMLAIDSVIKQTPSTSDDASLAKFEGGPVYRTISALLDFGASIKLPLISPPAPPK